MPATTTCPGCGARVPDVDGPVHAYMRSAPGCWALLGEVSLQPAVAPDLRVDAWAAQHPGGALEERRQRQSVGVHLTVLCLVLDLGVVWRPLPALRGRVTDVVRHGDGDWPYLPPPAWEHRLTVVDVLDAGPAAAGRWAADVWAAWEAHHPLVRGWARALDEGTR